MNLEYPYYRLVYKLKVSNIKKIIKNFKPIIITKYNSKFSDAIKYENRYFIIIDKWLDNYELNSLTDYWTEKVRIKCIFGNKLSPYDYWKKNKEQIVNSVNNFNIINLREQIFKETKLCNNFRISVVLTILRHFKTKKYLDISAGWGDRLLGAIFHKVKLYCGVDPNEDLHKYYHRMINKFVKKEKRNRFILLKSGFENAILPNDEFDLVFSSPPFFNLEKYSSYKSDSITKYNNEKSWCDNFLMVSIYKAINKLKVGGHLILYIYSSEYVDKRLNEINKIMKYKGMIYFYDKSLRGMHVWEKK
jgi:hypothetical protein